MTLSYLSIPPSSLPPLPSLIALHRHSHALRINVAHQFQFHLTLQLRHVAVPTAIRPERPALGNAERTNTDSPQQQTRIRSSNKSLLTIQCFYRCQKAQHGGTYREGTAAVPTLGITVITGEKVQQRYQHWELSSLQVRRYSSGTNIGNYRHYR